MLKVNEMQSYSYDEAHCGYGDSSKMESNTVLNGYHVAMSELLETRQNQVLRNAGVGARGFTWTDDFSNVHSANFAGMNTSGVVATGSWSSPSKDFAAIIGDDGHAVSSFDFINAIPTDGVFLDGVRNGYALIEDRNFGSVNHEVDNAAKTARPDESYETTFEASAKPGLNIQSSYQSQNNASANGAGFSSEDFGITHSSILAQEGEFHV